MPRVDNFGVMYVLTAGSPDVEPAAKSKDGWTAAHFAAAVVCSGSALRQAGYDGPIFVLCDHYAFDNMSATPFDSYGMELRAVQSPMLPDGNQIMRELNGMQASRFFKTSLINYVPVNIRRAAFFDADVIPLYSPFSAGGLASFDLGNNQLGIAQDLRGVANGNHGTAPEVQLTAMIVGEKTRQFNSGVMLFDHGPRSGCIFKSWHHQWGVYRDIDQLALLRALDDVQHAGARVSVLPRVYNYQGAHTLEHVTQFQVHNWHPCGYTGARSLFANYFKQFPGFLREFQKGGL